MIKSGQVTKISIFTILKNKAHFEKLGYNVAEIKASTKDYYNTYIDVSVDHLIASESEESIILICETCGIEYESTLKALISKRRKDFTKDYCKECKRLNTIATNLQKYGTASPAENKDVRNKITTTSIERYGTKCSLQNSNVKEKTVKTNIERYGFDIPNKSEQVKLKTKETNIEKYGTVSPLQNEGINVKTVKTLISKYNVTNAMQAPEVKSKYVATNIKRYGVSHPMRNPEIMERFKTSMFKKYGCINNGSIPETVLKRKQTHTKNIFNKYGVSCVFQIPEVKEKLENTYIKKYGTKYPTQSNMVKEKTKKSNLHKYGVSNPSQLESVKEKMRITCMEKYGVDHVMKVPEIRKKALGKTGSLPEKKFEEMLFNRGFIYETHYDVISVDGNKNFDFAIFNSDNALNTLIEIDGEYNHGLLNDSNGLHVCGDTDHTRFKIVPDGVKFIACNSKNIEQAFEELCSNFDISYADWLDSIFNICVNTDFPYPIYSDKRMIQEYNNLKINTYKPKSLTGQSIIRNFHKSIYTASVNNKPSPVEAWSNPKLLERCIKNRFIYANTLSTQAIADGFNKCKIAPKVSVFRAILARQLISKYLPDVQTIFDPFSGFSGRMLGTTVLNKNYIGQDISLEHVQESNQIIEFLHLQHLASVTLLDIENSNGAYESLFTCPPYSNIEKWNEKENTKSCDEWIELCMNKFKCKSYLFVVNETTKYAANIVETIVNTSHFSSNTEYVVYIDS